MKVLSMNWNKWTKILSLFEKRKKENVIDLVSPL